MNDYVCFVAGKSGGHLLPCISLAKKITLQDPAKKILFFTNQSDLDKNIMSSHAKNVLHKTLPLKALNRRSVLSYFSLAHTLVSSFCITLYFLLKYKPKKIISTGGAVSLPVCFAGALLKIPIELIELNVVPGKTIKALAPFATTLSICFKETQKYFNQKCFLTQYPLRFTLESRKEKKDARRALGLDSLKRTIFIVGGSQGSLYLNSVIKQWVEQTSFNKKDLQIIHQIGSLDSTNWPEFYAAHGIQAFTFNFYDHIEYCYSATDLVLCRSGAGTLFEVQFFDKSCITIPLETATTNHQIDNAHAFQKIQKSFIVVSQKNSNKEIIKVLDTTLKHLI